MRYYDIQITNPSTGAMVKEYTSYVNGRTDPGALTVELDVSVTAMHQPIGNSFVRVWGISLLDVAQASNLNGMGIKVFGGMQKGLPLANPAQAGLLLQGTVNQAFGNWQGTSMTLDMLVIAAPPDMVGPLGAYKPVNLSFNWPKGDQMSDAVTSAIRTAYPGYTVSTNISPSLVYPEAAVGYYDNLSQYGRMLNDVSKNIIGGQYAGVQISVKGDTISVWDGTNPNAAKPIAFNDLVGQISWDGPNLLNVKCVMRSDINVSDTVTLPPGQITTSAASLSQFKQGSVFQGNFMVQSVRHVGNSRQPDANSWVTVLTVYPAPPASA